MLHMVPDRAPDLLLFEQVLDGDNVRRHVPVLVPRPEISTLVVLQILCEEAELFT